jgi:hypothetical protein
MLAVAAFLISFGLTLILHAGLRHFYSRHRG